MTTKTKQIAATVLMAIPALVLIMGGVAKVIGKEPQEVLEFLTKYGFAEHIPIMGITELVIAGLLIYPKTNKIGFLLAGCYFAGALCLEIAGGKPPVAGCFIAILWIGMFIKNKQMFLAPAKP